MTQEQAETILISSQFWTEEDCALQWAIDLWYEALLVITGARAPA